MRKCGRKTCFEQFTVPLYLEINALLHLETAPSTFKSDEDAYRTPPGLDLSGNFDREYWSSFSRYKLIDQIKSHNLLQELQRGR